ncbi:MAG: hypothetical protein K1X64_07160 [Myxococcaceae bacterium]|nr:hypothetical protein [Myxococcaceae bacterium]
MGMFDAIGKIFSGASLSGLLGQGASGLLGGLLGEAGGALMSGLKSVGSSLFGGDSGPGFFSSEGGGLFSGLWTKASTSLGELGDFAKSSMGSLGTAISDGASKIGDVAKNAWDNIVSSVSWGHAEQIAETGNVQDASARSSDRDVFASLVQKGYEPGDLSAHDKATIA